MKIRCISALSLALASAGVAHAAAPSDVAFNVHASLASTQGMGSVLHGAARAVTAALGTMAGPDAWVGTKDQSLALEKFSVSTTRDAWPSCLELYYSAHVQSIGDVSAVAPNQVGRDGRRIEAVRFWLGGSCAPQYMVEYACHLQKIGDVGPVADGATCGTVGESRRLEAFKLTVRHR